MIAPVPGVFDHEYLEVFKGQRTGAEVTDRSGQLKRNDGGICKGTLLDPLKAYRLTVEAKDTSCLTTFS